MSFSGQLALLFNEIIDTQPNLSRARIEYPNTWFKRENAPHFLDLYYRLEDDASRKLLIKIIRNSLSYTLNGSYSKEPFFSASEWEKIKKCVKDHPEAVSSYELDVIETFILEGYRYNDICLARPGDTVLDCGAYTGNTAVYFSNQAGENGKVYAFEAMPATYEILEQNIREKNISNIFPFNLAISDKNGYITFTENASPASKCAPRGIKVKATTIDNFVDEHNIDHVDFIKMDIEGSEMEALAGAVETCRRFNPVLAISVYHKKTDLIKIPSKILEINPAYRFYLKHNSNQFHETVLFAIRGESPKNIIHDKDESILVSDIWSAMDKLIFRYLCCLRRQTLELCDLELKRLYPYPFEHLLDNSSYSYAYYPVSSDRKAHFEFVFLGNRKLAICLHMEYPFDKVKNLINEIIAYSECATPLQLIKTPPGCQYTVDDPLNYKHAANLMAYLMKISIPIIKRNKLISDYIINAF